MDASHIDVFMTLIERRDPGYWAWRQVAREMFWQAKYSGCQPPCELRIELGPAFVYFHAPLEMTVWAECRLAFYRYALRLNEEMTGAKLGINHMGSLALMVERPREGMTFAGFETALQILLTYYQLHYQDIQLVAQDVHLAHLTTMIERHALQEEIQAQVEFLEPAPEEGNGTTSQGVTTR